MAAALLEAAGRPLEGRRRMTKISVIYVSYNSGTEILASVDSLLAAGCSHELEIIVVDNASEDGSAAQLSGNPNLRLIANEVNLGYGRAVNLGIEAATGDYYLVLNPDVTVRPGAVDTLAHFLEQHPRVGMAGAKLLNEDGSLQHSCRSFYTFWTILLRRTPLGKLFPRSRAIAKHLMLDFDHAVARRVDWVLGACMLVRRRAVDEVGAMDKRFFLYFEDVDWCYRMGKRGWEVWYVPEALMTHVHKRTSARNPFSRSLLAHITSFVHYTEKWNPAAYLLKRYRNPVKGITLLLLDFVAAGGAYLAAIAIRRSFHLDYFSPDPYQRFALLYFLIVLGTFYLTGLYRIHRQLKMSEEFTALVRAGLLIGVALMSTTFLTKERIVSRAVILLSVPLLVLLSLLLRAGLRRLHRAFLRFNFDLRRLLIVGSAEEAQQLGTLILRHPEIGLDLVGRVAAEGDDAAGAMGTLAALERISEDERVQEVLFAPSVSNLSDLASTLVWCRQRNIDLRVLSDLAGVVSRGAVVEDWLGLPAISFRMEGLYPLQRFVKRLADLLLAMPALCLTLLPGLLHLLRSRRQAGGGLRRYRIAGRGGRNTLLPLPVDAAGRPLSDLLNPWAYIALLRGELSLVGPMPRSPEAAAAPELAELLAMRPGLTGYWRRRGDEERPGTLARMDQLYLRNWSPGLDVQLWLGTLSEQIRGHFPRELADQGGEIRPGASGEKGKT